MRPIFTLQVVHGRQTQRRHLSRRRRHLRASELTGPGTGHAITAIVLVPHARQMTSPREMCKKEKESSRGRQQMLPMLLQRPHPLWSRPPQLHKGVSPFLLPHLRPYLPAHLPSPAISGHVGPHVPSNLFRKCLSSWCLLPSRSPRNMNLLSSVLQRSVLHGAPTRRARRTQRKHLRLLKHLCKHQLLPCRKLLPRISRCLLLLSKCLPRPRTPKRTCSTNT